MSELTLTAKHIATFWQKVDVRGADECWLWSGWATHQGYGRFDVGRLKPLATHISLILSGRPRPAAPGNYALHGECSNPRCCNPHHLRWGSAAENAGDRERLQRRDVRGERNGCSKLTEDAVRMIRSSAVNAVALARELGVSQTVVLDARNRKTWTHVT